MIMRKEKVLVLGAGGVGAWTARSLVERGHQVVATTSEPQTIQALRCLGIQHLRWRWEPGASWEGLIALQASRWIVTVPPRMGMDQTLAFHHELQAAARRGRVGRLIWTSSTSVYDPNQSGVVVEENEGHHLSRHTGVDMLALENIHRNNGGVPFVALRLGGLFGRGRHPVAALLKRGAVQGSDGHVQWVHERDAAEACVFAAVHEDGLPEAINVVAPQVRTRRELIMCTKHASEVEMMAGGVKRRVSSEALISLGFEFSVPDPCAWVKAEGALTEEGVWNGPHGPLNWTKHASKGGFKGCALMVHGYKGFREWGLWRGLAERWAQSGWEVYRMDFSHNGHVAPFHEDCLDTEVWSQNRYHIEAEEVAFALTQLAHKHRRVMVMGHSRGGGMALLGGRKFEEEGGQLAGVACWAPVSNVFHRFPKGEALAQWQASDRLEVLNGRTGQILVHPYAFYLEAMTRASELDIQSATSSLSCPALVVHGTADDAVAWQEGNDIASWAARGTFGLVDGANHVFGMSHPWQDASTWPEHLSQAWEVQAEWLKSVTSP